MVRGPPGTSVKLGLRRPPRARTEQAQFYFVTLERTVARQSLQRGPGAPQRDPGQGRTYLVL